MGFDELVKIFLEHQLAMGRSPATYTHYADSLRLLRRFFSETGITLDHLPTSAEMTAFAAWLRTTPTRPWRGKTERSVYGVHGALKDCKVWVRWLEDQELIEKAPKIPVPRLPQRLFPVLTDADLDLIFTCSQVAGQGEVAVRNRALIGFMLDTGVRLSEVSSLTYRQIDLREGEAVVEGKGRKQRMGYFAPPTTEAPKRWVAIRGGGDGPLFWLSADGVRMVLRRIKDETGLHMLTAHQIRHTALTMLVRKDMDLHSIKRIAGHASVTTTESYLALAGQDIKDKHYAVSPFDQVADRLTPTAQRRRRLKTA